MTHTGAPDPRKADRLRWHARRGLLENDILLTRFLDRELAAMQDAEMQLLDELLRLDDNDLLDLLMGRAECKDARFQPLVARIRQASAGQLHADRAHNNTRV